MIMITKFLRGAFFSFLILVPAVMQAAVVQNPNGSSLQNPLKSKTLMEFLTAILEIMLVFAIPIIVLFIIYAGFLYVTAQGDESKIKTAHAALTWSVVGGVIILAAKLIVDVIQATVQSL